MNAVHIHYSIPFISISILVIHGSMKGIQIVCHVPILCKAGRIFERSFIQFVFKLRVSKGPLNITDQGEKKISEESSI
jgi:hypothetical protein